MADSWERVKNVGASTGEFLKDAATATGGKLKDAAVSAGDILMEASATTGKVLKDAGEAVGRTAGEAARSAANMYEQWLGEDTGEILTQCPVAQTILRRRETFDKDPEIFAQLYNVRLRPVLTAAVFGATGFGAAAFDETVSRFTRHIFDGEQLVGSVLGNLIAEKVGHSTVGAVNQFMDTVPGSGVMGGGWIHRIQHGHDIDALIQIGQDHGFEGIVQGLYHIFGRDFFTPAGIPILPAGSEQVYAFLVNQLNMTAESAADLISINCAEVAAFLALLMAAKLTWDCFKDYKERAELQNLVNRASRATADGDLLTACSLFEEALAVRPHEGTVSFSLGMTLYRMEKRLEAFLRFRDAAYWLARSEPTVEIGGAALSLRGAAAGMALASIDAPARTDRHGIDWINQLEQLAMAGVTAFQKVADDLINTTLKPSRHFSAALNCYLAGKLVGGSMYLAQREALLDRVYRSLKSSLDMVVEKGQHVDDLRFIERFAASELLPLTTR